VIKTGVSAQDGRYEFPGATGRRLTMTVAKGLQDAARARAPAKTS